MARLVHLNGPPGIGKSTLAVLWAGRRPGTLNLDVDVVHQLVGGWQEEDNRTWRIVWPLVRSMARTQLDTGRDVVLPQYHAGLDEITAWADLAHESGAGFHEIVLLADRAAAVERFVRRARVDDDPYIQLMNRHVGQLGGALRLETMYDELIDLVRRYPASVVVPSEPGAVEQTYALIVGAVDGPGG